MFTSLTLLALMAPAPPGDEITVIQRRTMEFPIVILPEKEGKLEQIRLMVTWDRGKTWALAGTATPDKKSVAWTAPHDGEVWATCQAVAKDGTLLPKYPGDPGMPVLKLMILTDPPTTPPLFQGPTNEHNEGSAQESTTAGQPGTPSGPPQYTGPSSDSLERLRHKIELLEARQKEFEQGMNAFALVQMAQIVAHKELDERIRSVEKLGVPRMSKVAADE